MAATTKKSGTAKAAVSEPAAGAKKSAGRKTAAKEPAGDPAEVFTALRAILAKHEHALVVKHDKPGRYYADTPMPHPKNGSPMFFGAAVVTKSYVSFHLMPIYAYPDLLKTASPELKKRMQGKSCFNFKRLEPALFRELAALTREGLERFQAVGLA